MDMQHHHLGAPESAKGYRALVVDEDADCLELHEGSFRVGHRSEICASGAVLIVWSL